MRGFVIGLLFISSPIFANWQSTMLTNGVTVKGTINSQMGSLSQMRSLLFKQMQQEFFLSRMDLVHEEAVSSLVNDVAKTKTAVRKHFFFVKSMLNIPEMLVTLQSTLVECLVNAAATCNNEIKIELSKPFKVYQSFYDLRLNGVNLSDIEVLVSAKYVSTKASWDVESKATFAKLYLLEWLQRARHIFPMAINPTVHQSLLFFKGHFENLWTEMQVGLQ